MSERERETEKETEREIEEYKQYRDMSERER